MDRCDAQRSASSGQELAAQLHLQWVRHLPELTPAWPDQPAMQFDAAYIPVVAGKTLYLGSPHDDSVRALDTATGAEKWRFVTDGPVRFAPLVWEDRVYFVADDGYLYCVRADTGRLVWKFRGGPSDRRILGNGRLISTWPARGAPVLVDGQITFAASIWPFMGIFIHTLDARTGKVIWTNDGDGAMYIQQPHHADAFAGVAPQGALVVIGDKLLLPGGRSVPACYERRTGKFVHYRLADNSGIGGGSEVAAQGHTFYNGGAVFDLETGSQLGSCGKQVVLTGTTVFSCSANECQAFDVTRGPDEETFDRKGNPVVRAAWSLTKTSSVPLPGVTTLIKAGSRLVAGAPNEIYALELPLGAISWRATIEGIPVHLAAADNRLFVSTRAGRLYCFGAETREANVHRLPEQATDAADSWTEKAHAILEATRQRAGYAVVYGASNGRLITELARQSQLKLIVIDADSAKVQQLRTFMQERGLYGVRVAVHVGQPETFALPPYLANLVVSEEPVSAALLPRLFQALRPYGGVACLSIPATERAAFRQACATHKLVQAQVREAGAWLFLTREGALPGAANWTHEHADAANTRVSRDQLVQAPLGVLWFGGTSHEGILPRHGHGPQPQVIDGRLIIEGVDMLRAIDIYTGRLLWEAKLPGLGEPYNHTYHHPGANATGTNYVSAMDGIYVVHGKGCLRLDPATGKTLQEFHLPALGGETDAPCWGFLTVFEDYLVAGANYLAEGTKGGDLSASKTLIVMNRHSGQVLWTVLAQNGFRHNGLCVGAGKLFALDRPSSEHLAKLKRRGETAPTPGRLVAYDLAGGKELWTTDKDVFGTWLSYSAKYDVVIEAGWGARDTLADEAHGMRTYRGANGQVLWQHPEYTGPAMIIRDTILKDNSACDLLSGLPRMRTDPLTGAAVPWTWSRGYGCNTPLASENLLTFRSGAAGFFDLANDGGTGNFGGFRSSCTNNLIVAGGVLTAPDYTRTCTCSYQNQTSLGLIHMPENEMWTYPGSQTTSGRIKRLALNFGAPGARKGKDGTLWLDFPHVGGPSPPAPVTIEPAQPVYFRRHSSQIDGAGPHWIGASGVKGLRALTVALDKQPAKERSYTVRLHFIEPDDAQRGQRVFHVALQGRLVLQHLDIVKETGNPRRPLVKEFTGVRVLGDLRVTLTPASEAHETVLAALEVIAED